MTMLWSSVITLFAVTGVVDRNRKVVTSPSHLRTLLGLDRHTLHGVPWSVGRDATVFPSSFNALITVLV